MLTTIQRTEIENTKQALMQMASGFWISQLLYTAAKLGLADYIKDGSISTLELSQKLSLHEDNLYRVMRTLASLGVFFEVDNQCFEHTPLSKLLCSDSTDGSMRAFVMMLGAENYVAWGNLYQAVKNGGSPFEYAYGMEVYQYFQSHPDSYNIFNQAMSEIVRGDNDAILESFDFSQFSHIVDIGAGQGTLVESILKKYTSLSATLFDLPEVILKSKETLTRIGLDSRCNFISGNFFETSPVGGDCYLLSRVLHGFDDERCVSILKNIHDVIPWDGKLILMEFLLKPGNGHESARSKLMDINMLVFASGGRDRTYEEYSTLLEKGMFCLENVYPTQSGIVILEAIPIRS